MAASIRWRLARRLRRLRMEFRMRPERSPRVNCLVRGATISIGVRSRMEMMRVLTYESKEPEILDWIDRMVRPGDVFYDVGANIGVYSLYAAAAGARVYAFEPEALNFARLNENIVANHRSGSIVGYPIGIADAGGIAELHLSEFLEGAALHAVHRLAEASDQRPAHRQGVLVSSLDELKGRFSLPAPTHIKIDVDGLEPAIVHGAALTLADQRLRSILIEINADQDALVDRITRAGFDLASRSKDGNYVFERAIGAQSGRRD